MSEIKWEAPPQSTHGWSVWGPIADALRERPGEWALIKENAEATGLGGNIAGGRLACFRPGGSFEAVTRKNPDGTNNTWARFIGTNGEHA